ncbi:hypothetical protein [Bradyrhizobium ottawaense]|uniref:hypothetical protein n=1 Tax=Bradyrhizobium ottawaense TaxID=931866 RepID=UPI001BA506D6|nr:hypothetical protein [Bradyrhizobium ottawaense]MBR1287754.1 hypothetical protein [Bradyrhizobium ottawaense]
MQITTMPARFSTPAQRAGTKTALDFVDWPTLAGDFADDATARNTCRVMRGFFRSANRRQQQTYSALGMALSFSALSQLRRENSTEDAR